MVEGRFWKQMNDHESYMMAKSKVVEMVDEALADFPKEPTIYDKLVYAGMVEAWRKRWFGV